MAWTSTRGHDHFVVEATGYAALVAIAIAPHVGRVVSSPIPLQVALIAPAKIKSDTINATVLAKLYAGPDDAGAAAASDAAQSNYPSAGSPQVHHPIGRAGPSAAALPACRPVRQSGQSLAVGAISTARLILVTMKR